MNSNVETDSTIIPYLDYLCTKIAKYDLKFVRDYHNYIDIIKGYKEKIKMMTRLLYYHHKIVKYLVYHTNSNAGANTQYILI